MFRMIITIAIGISLAGAAFSLFVAPINEKGGIASAMWVCAALINTLTLVENIRRGHRADQDVLATDPSSRSHADRMS